ncbi:MAG: hypothetical protein FJ095_04220 [Deltaproteobacteria bacterium]|nr:hypothetical protein [Deltaproteobacteria bacterium]
MLYRNLASLALAGALAFGSTGCLKKILLNGQIESTRKASAALNSVSDYEVARGAAFAGLAQFEGMHYLAPDNANAQFLLLRSWAASAFGFMEDEMEQAEDLHGEDSELALYHRARAVTAYARAIHYGSTLLEAKHPGFEGAQKSPESMQAYLAKFTDKSDAEPMLWLAQAWLSRVNLVVADDILAAGTLHVGVALAERSVVLDETYNNASGHVILGAYHSRSKTAETELPLAKTHFDRALLLTEGKSLLAKFNLAAKYFCTMQDKASYEKLLTEVVEAGDVQPEQRLPGSIARRKARRYLGARRTKKCAFEANPANAAAAPAVAPAAAGDADDDKDDDKE